MSTTPPTISKHSPRISIIIPSLNQGQFIKQSIDSVLEQGYPDLEIIVIDGGSKDNTKDVLESFGNKISWISEPDQGQSEAINKGLRICSGDICSFLNSDDYLMPGSLNKIVKAFNTDNPLWVTGDYRIVNEKGQMIQPLIAFYKRILRASNSKELLLIANYIIQPSTFWRRELNDRIGFFDENLHLVMDYDYWLRASAVVKPKIIPAVISSFRLHERSKGVTDFEKQFDEELRIAARYTSHQCPLILHRLHNAVITSVYRIIK